jgi:DnaK suppressor protein
MSLATGFSFDKYVLLQFKSGLREQQRELQQLVQQAEQAIRELADSEPGDLADAASGYSLEVSVIAQSRENRSRLRLVELALERIQLGTFGICDECEKAIGLKRLQAIPWTNHCIECQEGREQELTFSLVAGDLLRNVNEKTKQAG